MLIALLVCVLGPAVLASSDPEPRVANHTLVAHHTLVDQAVAESAGVSPDVLNLALGAVTCAVNAGDIAAPPTLTLIDYSRPSTEPRLWVFDLRSGQVRFRELVAHGKGTGENLAEHFSDSMNSHQSSLGLFVTRFETGQVNVFFDRDTHTGCAVAWQPDYPAGDFLGVGDEDLARTGAYKDGCGGWVYLIEDARIVFGASPQGLDSFPFTVDGNEAVSGDIEDGIHGRQF